MRKLNLSEFSDTIKRELLQIVRIDTTGFKQQYARDGILINPKVAQGWSGKMFSNLGVNQS